MITHYRIADGDRWVEFDGELLASATSDDGKAQRWTVFELYRTNTDRYVLHKVGRSVVYHAANSSCTRQAEQIRALALLHRDMEVESHTSVEDAIERLPCRTCTPVDIYEEHDPELEVLAERDRHSVVVSGTARGIVDSLYGKDANDTLFLTRVAERLIRSASLRDEGLRQAWEVQAL